MIEQLAHHFPLVGELTAEALDGKMAELMWGERRADVLRRDGLDGIVRP
jgi:hypothetical protein